ncbi:hypothetical protein [Anaerobacillus alkaliphilus]|nr:hypothetical protein [Anaerobacillus alkaliphilus]
MTIDIITAVLAIFILRELVKTKSELREIKEYVKKIADKDREV